jgi:hypothetical protein
MTGQSVKKNTRRQLLFMGISAAAFFSVFGFLKWKQKKKTVKMLTEDGRLVEVDADILPKQRERITHDEIHSWVKTKK